MKIVPLVSCSVSVLAGCLEPLVSDEVVEPTLILPAGSIVPSLLDDPEELAQIIDGDGLSGPIIRQTAFANGQLVHAWNFGPAPAVASPLFVIARRDTNGDLARIPEHNTVIEAVPGDPRYSPFWAVFFVEVTPMYDGELLTSFAAVSEAVERGLVEAPALQTFAVNCPIAGPDVVVDAGNGTIGPNATFYYEGKTVPYYDFGPMPLVAGSTIPESRRVVLRREGGEPLSEIVRHVDLTGDGDTTDTNDILEAVPNLMASPRMRTVTLAVPSGTPSIDTSRSEALADVTSMDQLFAPDPTALVVSYTPTDEVANWVVQATAGGL